jgi:hypothetical protein
MPEYRVYFIDGSGGIADAHWLNASTDDEAMHAAERLESHFIREVWQYQRQVGRHQPD